MTEPTTRKRPMSPKAAAEYVSELHKQGMKVQEMIANRDGLRIIFGDKRTSKQSRADQWIEENA